MSKEGKTPPLLVSVIETARLISTSKQNVYALAKADPDFPRIFRFGKRRSGILYAELEAWVAKKRGAT